MIGFGQSDVNPMELENPFPDNEGSVHLWHGIEDGIVPISLQRYIAKQLPWIHFHEIPDAGHLFLLADSSDKDAILKTLLLGDK